MWTMIYAAVGAFAGATAGMVLMLKAVAKKMMDMLDKDPDVEKIEIKVVMNRVPE